MRKVAIGLTFTILVAIGVWYMVTTVPLKVNERPTQAQPADTTGLARRAIGASALPPLGLPTCGGRCGSYRWLVKTLADPDRERVRLDPIETTIDQLINLQQPLGGSDVSRVAPVELTVYRVEARLLALFGESDGDFHLVLASSRDPTVTMIAEVPNPECEGACASGFAELYGRVRQALIASLDSPQSEAHPLIRVAGVGFFDYVHGLAGVAPNGIELHPVLNVEFVGKGR